MQINMTVDLQTALVERLKTTIANTVGENLLITIVAEKLNEELIEMTAQRNQLVEANTRLNAEVSELRQALAAKQNKFKPSSSETN